MAQYELKLNLPANRRVGVRRSKKDDTSFDPKKPSAYCQNVTIVHFVTIRGTSDQKNKFVLTGSCLNISSGYILK